MLSNNEDKPLATEETIPIGSIVSNNAHPYQEHNTNILITTYAHFTPPLMVVVEKNYGAKFSSTDGEKEDNDSYKCIYYSTINGCFEANWFKKREIKLISKEATKQLSEKKDAPLEDLKKYFLGKMGILLSVDLELEKKKVWSDDDEEGQKMKKNNLLDYLPPLGSIIDVKLNEDHQKFNDKNGKPIHKKSKVLVKLRWLNNITAKYSEEYVPLEALKLVDINYKAFDYDLYYMDNAEMVLEEIEEMKISKSPVRLKEVYWKHYYYIYCFVNQFTGESIKYPQGDLKNISESTKEDSKKIQLLLKNTKFEYAKLFDFFKLENKANFEKKWFEIQYSDKNEKYSKRIIYINEIIVEKTTTEPIKDRVIIKANCLLRNGKIRHFNVIRIQGYREMPHEFNKMFVLSNPK